MNARAATALEDEDASHRAAPAPASLAGFCAAAEQARVRRGAPQAAIMVMRFFDLPEFELLFGRDAAQRGLREAECRLRACAADAIVGRAAPDTFLALCAGQSAQALQEAVRDGMGVSCAIEFEVDGDDVLLVPELMWDEVRAQQSVAHVFELASRCLEQRQREEARRCDWLRQEREWHSRPVPLPESAPLPGRWSFRSLRAAAPAPARLQ